MKIKDMIMVVENRKGVETNMLCTLTDYVQNFMFKEYESQMDVIEEAMKLQETKSNDDWLENYEAANVTVSARYCSGEAQLRLFLKGIYNDMEGMASFSEERSSEECLKHLKKVGIRLDGSLENINQMRYEKLEKTLKPGDVVHNLNGTDYRVLECYSDKDILFVDVVSGNFVVGVGVEYFAKYPKTQGRDSEDCVYGIEWGHGVYLGDMFSQINFEILRKEYKKQEEVIEDGKKEFDIEITETLQRVQKVEAECLGDAIDKAMEMYYGQQIVLDAEDMKDVEFNQYKDKVEEQGKKR